MMLKILCFCLLSFHLLGLNSQVFYARLRAPTPQWMIDQIQEDLSPFTQELSRRSIDELFTREDYSLVRVRIVNGKLDVQKSERSKKADPIDRIISRLHALNALVQLPDSDFVFTVYDALPYPGLHSVNIECFAPVFCITKYIKDGYASILMPDWYALDDFDPLKKEVIEGNRRFPWDSKLDIVFYRGADRGFKDVNQWLDHPRTRLIQLSLKYPDLIDARFYTLYSPLWDYAAQLGFLAFRVPMEDHPRYKYLINVDAACAATPRVPVLLHSNSVLFQNTTNSNLWFFRLLKPYVHYVPVAPDLSDLLTQIEWAKAHDEECKKISLNARHLASDVLTHEAVLLYLYRLIEAYSEKQKLYYYE